LHKVGYFRDLLKSNPDINESLRSLLQLCRETLVRLQKTENAQYGRWSAMGCSRNEWTG